MIVGGYTLDLYCDAPDCYAVERHNIQMRFAGHAKADCVRQAKRLGWYVGYKKQYCPSCMGKMATAHAAIEGLEPVEDWLAVPQGRFKYGKADD